MTAVVAALYAAVLIPFKVFTIIPGFTEFRPANAIAVLGSFLFGPAAAWGSAFGNTIGDFAGTLGPGTLFGLVGNLLFGYVPYRVWGVLGKGEPVPRAGVRWWLAFLTAAFLASLACAMVIGWGLELLGLVPFRAITPVILANNFLTAVILVPPLLLWIYPRVARWGLTVEDLLPEADRSNGIAPRLGLALLAAGLLLGFGAGFVGLPFLPAAWADWAVVLAVAPFLGVALAGSLLI